MRSMKTRGLAEVQAARKRAQRLAAMGRVSEENEEYIVSRLKEVEARIVEMREETGEEEF
jgi:hypothetical protein